MSKFSKIILTAAMLFSLFSLSVKVLAVESFIPPCALEDPKPGRDEGECRDVGIFVKLFINIAQYVFSFVGALALLFFIYGGFVLILSQGNTDKVKKGKDVMVAAIIGLIVVFGAYTLVKFLGDVVGVEEGFKLK